MTKQKRAPLFSLTFVSFIKSISMYIIRSIYHRQSDKKRLCLQLIAVFLLAGFIGVIPIHAQNDTVLISSLGEIRYNIEWTMLRDMDFETGDFSQQGGGDQTHNVSITTEVAHSGVYSAKCSAPPEAAGIRIWGGSPGILDWTEYPETYWEFWVYVEEGFEVPAGPQWQLLAEWNAPHPVSGDEHVAIMFMTADGITNNLFLQFYSNYATYGYDMPYEWGVAPLGEGPDRAGELFSGVEMPTGRWVHFETFYKVDATDGIISVKMDGIEINRWEGQTLFSHTEYYEAGSTRLSYQLSNYCDLSLPPHDIYFDDILIYVEEG